MWFTNIIVITMIHETFWNIKNILCLGWFEWVCAINVTIWATSWENLFLPYANNKGADQPAHPHSLIIAFVICCLDSIIPPVSMSEISSLYIASVAAQAGLSLPWLQTPNDRFSCDEAQMHSLAFWKLLCKVNKKSLFFFKSQNISVEYCSCILAGCFPLTEKIASFYFCISAFTLYTVKITIFKYFASFNTCTYFLNVIRLHSSHVSQTWSCIRPFCHFEFRKPSHAWMSSNDLIMWCFLSFFPCKGKG